MPTELDGFMARLQGDPSGLIRAFNEASQKAASTGAALVDAMQKAGQESKAAMGEAFGPSTADKAAGWASTVAGYAGRGFQAIKTSYDTFLKPHFQTTGDALRGVGDIAGMIPGPWGQAIGAVTGLLGGIVDWFDGPMQKSLSAARQGFIGVATGAQTVNQAVLGIRLDAMKEGLERLMATSDFYQGVRNVVGGDSMAGRMMRGSGVDTNRLFGPEAEQAGMDAQFNRIQRQTRQRLDFFRGYMERPQLQGVRQDMAMLQAEQSLMDMTERVESRRARREMMQAMSGRSEDTDPRRAAQATVVMQVARQIQNYGESLESARQRAEGFVAASTAMQNRIEETSRAIQRQAAISAADRLTEQLRGQVEQGQRAISTFAMSSREAAVYNHQMDLLRLNSQIATAETAGLTVAQRNQLVVQRDQIQARIEALRQQDVSQRGQENQMREATSVLQTAASYDAMRAAQEGVYRTTADTSRQEAELQVHRTSGRLSSDQVAAREREIAVIRSTSARQQLTQAAQQVSQQTLSSLQTYNAEQDRLNQLLALNGATMGAEGITWGQWAIMVERANDALRAADPYWQRWNAQAQAGHGIVERFRTPQERLIVQQEQLDRALQLGTVNQEDYARSMALLGLEAEHTGNAISGIQGAARGSAEAMGRLANFQNQQFTTQRLLREASERGRALPGASALVGLFERIAAGQGLGDILFNRAPSEAASGAAGVAVAAAALDAVQQAQRAARDRAWLQDQADRVLIDMAPTFTDMLGVLGEIASRPQPGVAGL